MTKWYENIARMCNVPLIMIDIPYNNTVEVADQNVRYVRGQFDKAIKQLEELTGKKFDEKLGELLPLLKDDDLLILTADHGNDPTYTGTDHTREKVPFIAWSPSMACGGEMEENDTFAVIGATIADNFGVAMPEGTIGSSRLEEIEK